MVEAGKPAVERIYEMRLEKGPSRLILEAENWVEMKRCLKEVHSATKFVVVDDKGFDSYDDVYHEFTLSLLQDSFNPVGTERSLDPAMDAFSSAVISPAGAFGLSTTSALSQFSEAAGDGLSAIVGNQSKTTRRVTRPNNIYTIEVSFLPSSKQGKNGRDWIHTGMSSLTCADIADLCFSHTYDNLRKFTERKAEAARAASAAKNVASAPAGADSVDGREWRDAGANIRKVRVRSAFQPAKE